MHVSSLEGHHEEIAYDHLIVALGSVSRTLPIPGLARHAIGFKTLAEAIALRNRIIGSLEMAETVEDPDQRAQYLTYVFVGAGYAGLEGLAELQDFAADVIDLYPRCRMQGMRWMLVEANDRVMPEIPADLAAFASASCAAAASRSARDHHRGGHRHQRAPVHGRGGARRARSRGRPASSPTRWSRGSACRSAEGGRLAGGRAPARSRATRACGRSATAPRCPTRRARDSPARRRPSTRIRQGRVVARNVAAALGRARASAPSATARSACS